MLANHSVFAEGDVEVIRERLELAYRTLMDPTSRAAYDAALERERSDEVGAERVLLDAALPSDEVPASPLALAVDSLDLEELDDGEEGAEFDGARLRRSRLRGGIELDQIAKITKVSPTYLQLSRRSASRSCQPRSTCAAS